MDILVVDDKKPVQHMLTELLTSVGHTVDTANNGLDGLSKAQTGKHNLFIIDHLMPLMDGVQLIKNLKSNSELADNKVIFMTTQGSESLKTLAEFTHFDKVIEKPINKEKFLAVLLELVGPSYIREPIEAHA